MSSKAERKSSPVAETWVPESLGRLLVVGAVAFLAMLFTEVVASRWLDEHVPSSIHYFGEIACLFPTAARVVTDYRAEGWSCEDQRFHEIDVRPYFPIDAEEKENRFQRTLQFYRSNRPTMQALERYVVTHYDEDVLAERAAGRSERPLIGGVRFSSLRIPLGSVDAPVERYSRKPLSDYPHDQRKNWFWTPRSRRERQCRELDGSFRPEHRSAPSSSGESPEDP